MADVPLERGTGLKLGAALLNVQWCINTADKAMRAVAARTDDPRAKKVAAHVCSLLGGCLDALKEIGL